MEKQIKNYLTNPMQLRLRLILATIAFLVAFKLVDVVVLSAVGKILIDMESDQRTTATVYFSRAKHSFQFNQENTSSKEPVQPNVRRQLHLSLKNSLVGTFRLDPGTSPGVYRIYEITPLSFFGDIETIHPASSAVNVIPGPETIAVKKGNYLEIIAKTNDPYVIFDVPVKANNLWFQIFGGIFAGFFIFIVTHNFCLQNCKVWQDTVFKKSSSGMNFASLDGFRGLAATFVLISHAGIRGCHNLGPIGVVMFFCLSGFLLTLPFAKYPEAVTDYRNFRNYYARRLKRIVPMFYFYLFVAYFFEARIIDFIRTALFLQGNGVLWTIIEEMHFYVFLPIVFLAAFHVFRSRYLPFAVVLLAVGFCFNQGWLPTYYIYGFDTRLPIFAGVFMTGVLVCYLYHINAIRNSTLIEKICSNHLLSIVLVIAFITTVTDGNLFGAISLLRSNSFYMGNYNYLIGIMLFCIVLGRGSIVARFLASLPMRVLGTISYSFYILHPLCLEIVKKMISITIGHPIDNTYKFIGAFLLTFFLSILTYTYIERPFIKEEKLQAKQELSDSRSCGN